MTRLTTLTTALAAGMTSFAAHSQEPPALAAGHYGSTPPQAEQESTAAAARNHAPADYHAHAGDRGMSHLVEPAKAAVVLPDRDEAAVTIPEIASSDEGEAKPEAGRREVEVIASERDAAKEETKSSPVAASNQTASPAAANPAKGGRFGEIVARHASRHGIPVSLAHAVIAIESNYRADARGRAGEVGLMQIKPATARGLGFSGSVSALFNPETNIRYGMKYLGQAHRLGGGDTCRTILKYNAGHGARRMNPTSAAYCSKVKRIMGGA